MFQCSSHDLFDQEVDNIKECLSANGYPANFIKHHVSKFITNKSSNNHTVKDIQYGHPRLPFKGVQSTILRRQLLQLFTKIAPWTKLITIFLCLQ